MSILIDLESVLEPLHVLRTAYAIKIHYDHMRMTLASATTQVEMNTSPDVTRTKDLANICATYSAKNLAHDLFAIQRGNFLRVGALEFARQGVGVEESPDYNYLTHYGSQLTTFVTVTTLLTLSLSPTNNKALRRANKTVDFWLKVAEYLHAHGDYFSTQNVLLAIDSHTLERLGLDIDKKKRLHQIFDEISNSHNFASYRAAKARRLEKNHILIPLCAAETSTLKINSDFPPTVEKFRGVKTFNTALSDMLLAVCEDWKDMQTRLRSDTSKGGSKNSDLQAAILLWPEEYAHFLSYRIKPMPAPQLPDAMVPLWSAQDFANYYNATINDQNPKEANEFANTIEQAILRGWFQGIPIFYAYLAWIFKPEDTDKTTAAFFTTLVATLFKHYGKTDTPNGQQPKVDYHFLFDVISTFDDDSKGKTYYPYQRAEFTQCMMVCDRNNIKAIARARFIIFCVKHNLREHLLTLRDVGIGDNDSFLEVVFPLVTPAPDFESAISFQHFHSFFKKLGLNNVGKRTKLKTLYCQLMKTNG